MSCAPAPAFAGHDERTLVGFHFPRQPITRHCADDKLAQMKVEPGRRVAMDSKKFGRPRRRPSDAQLQESALFVGT